MSSRPLRVLIVGPSLAVVGGQAVQAARMVEHFRRDSRIEVGFLPLNPGLPMPLGAAQRIKYVRTIVTTIWYVASLLVKVPRYDVVHIFSASYWSFLLSSTPALLVGKLYRKRTILNYRSGEASDHLARWRSARATLCLAGVIVVPSGYLVDVFGQFGFTATSILNTVDTSRFQFRERRPLRPVFVASRNFEALYNVACIVRAFALVQGQHPEARLTLAGDGPQRADLEALVRRLGLRNVDFAGRVPNATMPALYDAADIFLNSPNIDNMPGSVIEAFAAGTLVITTRAGGIPYIVTHERTGLLVPLNDHQEMAAQALRLLADPQFASRLASSARAECRRYEWSAVRDEWLRLYGFVDRQQVPMNVTPIPHDIGFTDHRDAAS